ncbi:GTP cyclohydrolase [Bacillus sp. GBSW2]|uniref:GTP cyclohydrolase II n=1 Tax=Bacillus sp. GBSW2 TaxID=2108541 RepID=UPI000D03F23E|nr:GTP cyclohydrolase II [Bacillus sp. GBSW2]PRS73595.1 GTP cyclohydrolase [Bacillus sp. GBSW2]
MNKFVDELQSMIHHFTFQEKNYLLVGPVNLPISIQHEEVPFKWYAFAPVEGETKPTIESIVQMSTAQQTFSSCLLFGDFENEVPPLVRIHSVCQTGDVFGSLKCDCGPQLALSLKKITDNGKGMLVYMANQEGRSIGLMAKALTYKLQEMKLDTFEANRLIGCGDDDRHYEEAAAVLHYLNKGKPMHLLTNNPDKVDSIAAYGLPVLRFDHTVEASLYNAAYLKAKAASGHMVDEKKLINQ